MIYAACLLFGMAIQATITGVLAARGIIHLTPEQQLLAGVMFAIVGMLVLEITRRCPHA
jgi:hypothetical protein